MGRVRLPVALLGVAAITGGACGPSLRIGPPLDLASHAARLAASAEIHTGPPIVRLRLPAGWSAEYWGPYDIVFEPPLDVDGRPTFADLPKAELRFHDPQGAYGGGVFYITPRERLDVGEFRRHDLRDGFARNIDDALLSPARIDGRDAFIVRGRFDKWNSALTKLGARRTSPRGDVALAAVYLPNLVTLVVVILVSEPARLSRDPGLALDIFSTCRFTEPRRPPKEYKSE
jgi:hypothetical protein